MSDDTTARLTLPLLQPGQAQKEMTHNESLALLDIGVQAAVQEVLGVPPPTPAAGQCWIVGPGATGDWTGHDGQLAGWTTGGWRFLAATEGMAAWLIGAAVPARYRDGAWRSGEVRASSFVVAGNQVVGIRQPAIAVPTGGSTVDGEARAALAQLLAAARAHGLIAT